MKVLEEKGNIANFLYSLPYHYLFSRQVAQGKEKVIILSNIQKIKSAEFGD
jgi:hypothetical protein